MTKPTVQPGRRYNRKEKTFEDIFYLAPEGKRSDYWTRIRHSVWEMAQRETRSKVIEHHAPYYNPTGANIVFMCSDGWQVYAQSLMLKKITNFCSIIENGALQDAFGQTVIVLPDTNAASVSTCLDLIYNGNMIIEDDTPQTAVDSIAATLKVVFGIELVTDTIPTSGNQTSDNTAGKSNEDEKHLPIANINEGIDKRVSQMTHIMNKDVNETICIDMDHDDDNITDIASLCPLEIESQQTIDAINNLNEIDLNPCTEEADESINAKNGDEESIYDLGNKAIEHTPDFMKELGISSNCSKKSHAIWIHSNENSGE